MFVSRDGVQIGVFIQNASTKTQPAWEIKYQAIISEGEVEGQSKRAKDEQNNLEEKEGSIWEQ